MILKTISDMLYAKLSHDEKEDDDTVRACHIIAARLTTVVYGLNLGAIFTGEEVTMLNRCVDEICGITKLEFNLQKSTHEFEDRDGSKRTIITGTMFAYLPGIPDELLLGIVNDSLSRKDKNILEGHVDPDAAINSGNRASFIISYIHDDIIYGDDKWHGASVEFFDVSKLILLGKKFLKYKEVLQPHGYTVTMEIQ